VSQAAQESRAAQHPKEIALIETVEAIQNILSGAAKPDAAHPLELTVEDLAKAFRLSKSTRRLLGGSHITLSLDAPPHHGHFGCAEYTQPYGLCARRDYWYSAIVPVKDGSYFAVAFDPANHNPVSVGLCAGQPPPPPERGLVRVP